MHCHPAQAVASCAAQAKHLVSFGVAYPLMQEVFEGLTPAQIANSLLSLCLSLTTHVPSV